MGFDRCLVLVISINTSRVITLFYLEVVNLTASTHSKTRLICRSVLFRMQFLERSWTQIQKLLFKRFAQLLIFRNLSSMSQIWSFQLFRMTWKLWATDSQLAWRLNRGMVPVMIHLCSWLQVYFLWSEINCGLLCICIGSTHTFQQHPCS